LQYLLKVWNYSEDTRAMTWIASCARKDEDKWLHLTIKPFGFIRQTSSLRAHEAIQKRLLFSLVIVHRLCEHK